MKTAYLIDSTAGFLQEYSHRDDIYEVTLSAMFPNGETVFDSPDLKCMERFRTLRNQFEEKPTSSQPSLGEIYDVFEQICKEGYDEVYCVTLGSLLSGTYNSVLSVAQEYEDIFKTYIYDTRSAVTTPHAVMEEIIRLVEAGETFEVIDRRVNYIIDESRAFLIMLQLDSLQEGGRLELSEESLIAHNNFKAIIEISDEGKLFVLDKVRTERRREEELIRFITEKYEQFDGHVSVIMSNAFAEEEMIAFRAKIQQKHPDIEVHIRTMTPSLMCHLDDKGYIFGIVPNMERIDKI